MRCCLLTLLWSAALACLPAQEAAPQPEAPAKTAPAKTAVVNNPKAKVDGLLFFATNSAVKEISEDLQEKLDEQGLKLDPASFLDLRQRLAKAFPGQKNYQLLGRHTQDVLKDYESWVVPSKELCLKIDSRGPAPDKGIKLHVQLWQEQTVLVKCDAVLTAKTPIFIGGPDWKDGRLVFVLVQK